MIFYFTFRMVNRNGMLPLRNINLVVVIKNHISMKLIMNVNEVVYFMAMIKKILTRMTQLVEFLIVISMDSK